MKKIISLLISAALALSCVMGVIAAVPEDTAQNENASDALSTGAEGTETEAETDGDTEDETETEKAEETQNPLLSVKYELTYDSNINSDYSIDGDYTLPQSVVTSALEAVAIEAVEQDETLIAIDGSLQYILTFKSWNTSPDGDGTTYMPGREILLKSDTTLYAVWDYELILADIELSVAIIEPDDAEAPEDDVFIFTVSSSASDEILYTIYGTNGKRRDNGTAELPAEFEISAGESVKLEATPGTYTIIQDEAENYEALDSYSTRFSVESGQRREVVFENLYIEPLGTMTVHQIGDIDEATVYTLRGKDDTNSGIEVTFIIPQGEESITLTDLPMGAYVVEYHGDWSYRFDVSDSSKTGVLRNNGDKVNIAFEFYASDLVNWLTSAIYYFESFAA